MLAIVFYYPTINKLIIIITKPLIRSSKNSKMYLVALVSYATFLGKASKQHILKCSGGRSGKLKKLPVTTQIFSSYKMILLDLSLANRHETTRRGGSEYEVK